jgi:hypothetical protein
MAIFHLSLKSVSRRSSSGRGKSEGRSAGDRNAVAAAAYRAGENLHDPVTGKTFDFTNRQNRHAIEHSEVMVPATALADGGKPPEWATDRGKLWAHVEQFEKRKDASLARELQIALPKEFTKEQRIAAVRDFVQEHVTAKGMIADVSLHSPPRGGQNWHAHILMTTRPLAGQEFGQPPKIGRGTGKGQHVWASKAQLHEWRAEWAKTLNLHLERANLPDRVDHRSYAARGIDREVVTLCPQAWNLEQAGIATREGDAARAAALRNTLIEITPQAVAAMDMLEARIDQLTSPLARQHAMDRLEHLMDGIAATGLNLAAEGRELAQATHLPREAGKGASAASKAADAALTVMGGVLAVFDIGGGPKKEPRESVDDRMARLAKLAQDIRHIEQDEQRRRDNDNRRTLERDDDERGGRERSRDR